MYLSNERGSVVEKKSRSGGGINVSFLPSFAGLTGPEAHRKFVLDP